MMDIFPFFSTNSLAKLIFGNRILKYVCWVLAAGCFTSSIALLVYGGYFNDGVKSDFYLNRLLPITLVPLVIILFLASSYYLPDLLEMQLEKIREERMEITQKIENEKEQDIFHTIQLSLNQLNEYYTINKGQAKSSFRFSVIAILLGLLTILVGVWLNYSGQENVNLVYISGISGTILEFIGGAYFFMYKKSLEQINLFFGQLIKIEDTMLAIKLADGISIEERKIEMREKIILSLLERSL